MKLNTVENDIGAAQFETILKKRRYTIYCTRRLSRPYHVQHTISLNDIRCFEIKTWISNCSGHCAFLEVQSGWVGKPNNLKCFRSK